MAGKSSAVADVAAQAGPDPGRSMAHTRDDAGAGDLFAGLDAEVSAHDGATIAPPAKRGPGRPANSPNRSTLQLQRYLMASGARDPAEFLASIVSMDTRKLAETLRPDHGKPGANPATFDQVSSALDVQVRAARELMPYFHQKMPIAVQHSGNEGRPVIVINDHSGGASRRVVDGVARAMSIHDVEESEADQGLSQGDGGKSHGNVVDADG